MEKRRISSGTAWEEEVGYSRAVRVDNEIHVSGTTATDDDGTIVGEGDPYRQTEQAISNIADALREAGASLDDVIRTRMYVVDIDDWEEIGRAHGDALSTARPATSMVEVERLIDPEMLVEIEAVACVED
jgi:enamine deaminase RidA (YjgF/YER057c/UK114 family)